MDNIETFLSMMPNRIPFGGRKSADDKILTPPKIAKEMVEALPPDVWNSNTTFLDPVCKSGIFLYEIYKKLMYSEAVIADFPDRKERHFHIINNQLYGIAMDQLCQMISMRTAYGQLMEDSHIISLSDYMAIMRNTDRKFLYEVLKKEFNTVKFDVVIGNPPYNNDIYLDFVQLGHKLSNKYTIMITPAKWQAKGGKKNEQFRKEIIPYMSEIIYYPYSEDVFDVTEVGGITYYCIRKELSNKLTLSIKKNTDTVFHNEEIIEVEKSGNRYTYYDSTIENMVSKVACGNRLADIIFIKEHNGDCMVKISHLVDDKRKSNCIGGFIVTPTYIENRGEPGQNKFELFAGNEITCSYFKSYIDTKFVRFFVALGLCASSIRNKETWRFVPAPEAFDHIFTDAELYEKYNLSEEEINIIESVIKERK